MTLPGTVAPSNSIDNWTAILELGRYAPTPHNTQWYFLHPIDGEIAKVGIDNAIQLPYTDPDNQFRFTGLGVFVRHLELSAQATGFKLETEINLGDNQYPVTVRITSKHLPDAKLAKLITERQTSRLAYKKEPIASDAAQILKSMKDGQNEVNISSDETIVNSVLTLNNQILVNDLQEKGLGDELDDWIRYTKKSQAKHPSGFTPETLASSAWKIWLIFKFRHIMLIGPLKKWLVSEYLKQNQAATVGWIYGPLMTEQNQYDAGRFMMDVWLKITEKGYYMQPYGSIITNHDARQQFLINIKQTEEKNKMVWLAFRIGTSRKPNQSPRKSAQEYIR